MMQSRQTAAAASSREALRVLIAGGGVAGLEAAFGLCVGCKLFYLGMRLGLVPAGVCVECARVLAAPAE